MSSSNTPAKRARSDSNGKPAKKQRLSTSNLITAPNLHVYSKYIDAKESAIIDNIDEIHEEDIPHVLIAATDDIDFYKKTISELQEKLTFCRTQVGLCGQLLGQLIARNASRVDLKKLLSPRSNDSPHKKLPTSPVALPPFSPINSGLADTSISSQLTPLSAHKRSATPPSKTVTRSVSAAEKGHGNKKAKSAVHTQMSSDTSSSDEDEPQTPMQIEAAKASPRGRVAPSSSLEPNLFLVDDKVRSATIESSTYTQAHEMKPRSLIFNPHRANNFTTASFDGSVKFWQFNENYTGDKDIDDDEEQMTQTGIITGKHMKHTRPPADISWSKWEERLAILFPQASSNQKGTNCQLVLVEASRMPTVSGLFLNTKPHTKDPVTIRWVSRNKLVSGGLDHAICSWNVNYEAKSCETNVLHTNHSSGVTAIHVLDDYVYSGGSDKKLICWNMKTETEVQHLKLDEKITSIIPCPAQEKIFLVSKMSHSSQLAIFDSRTSKAEMTLSYKAGVRNSSYVTPSWETSGTWVCCGSTEPLLNLWDLRYSEANLPAYSWKMHKSRIFKAEFVPNESKILTLSSDHYLGCHQLAF